MCDPVGAITLAGAIIATCYSYGCGIADAPKEAQTMGAEISSLAGLLVGVQAIASSRANNYSDATLSRVLDECQNTLQHVSDRLREHDPNLPRSRWQRNKKRVLWPLSTETTVTLIAAVERQKVALSIALGASALKGIETQNSLIKDVQSTVDDISDQLGAMQSAQERAGISKWLSKHDHTALYRQASEAYCENTCLWILENPHFKYWLDSCPSSLWLPGPTGSGKTVLSSFVIELIQARGIGDIAYFHCSANTSETLKTEVILGSLLSQLCGSEVPACITHEYRQASAVAGTLRPAALDKLQIMLTETAKLGCEITFVLDGIDEASEPEFLCEFLCSLVQLPDSKVRFFLTSRPHVSIQASLRDVSKLVANPKDLNRDIEVYVGQRLRSDKRLAKLSENTRSHIYWALVSKSHGMFRWAQCQLDETSRMRSEGAIDQALSSLPKSLQETYQRALEKVSDFDKIYLRRTMLWLTWSIHPLKLVTIVDAIVLEQGMAFFDSRARLNDAEELLDICGTFAVYQESLRYNHEAHQLRLAHHSVREFFENLGPGSDFWLPAKASHRELAELCLAYLLLDDWTKPAGVDGIAATAVVENQLLQYAAASWPQHVLRSGAETELQPLIGKLMTTSANSSFLFWIHTVIYGSRRTQYLDFKPQPLYYAASYGLVETVASLISQNAELDVKAGVFGGTALHAACWRRHPEIVGTLLDAGADPSVKDHNDMTCVDLAIWNPDSDVAQALIEHSTFVPLEDEKKETLLKLASRKTVAIPTREIRQRNHPKSPASVRTETIAKSEVGEDRDKTSVFASF